MGKSPGKWIKAVFFGKKNSKSNLSKSSAKIPVVNQAGKSLVVTDLSYQTTEKGEENIAVEKETTETPCDTSHVHPVNQNGDLQSNLPLPVSDTEMKRREQAAKTAQAAFRGYLARRAFRALKGIIRLQALGRGHLVRRQAVATFHSMQAIVRLQALARGRRVRLSDLGFKVFEKYSSAKHQDAKQVDVRVNSFLGSKKLAANIYLCKILVTLNTARPLRVQYNLADPNSAWNWLERWSLFYFSEPCALSNNCWKNDPHRQQDGTQTVETVVEKSKGSIGKISNTVARVSLVSTEIDKPKCNTIKVTSHHSDLLQEHPQSELERVKRSLRKVSAAVSSEKSKMETKKSQSHQNMKEHMNDFSHGASEQKIVISSETSTDPDTVADKLTSVDEPSKVTKMYELEDILHDDQPAVELNSLATGGIGKIKSSSTLNEESSLKKEQFVKENHKIRKRSSLPLKQEYTENVSLNTPRVPSYMAATESAKAKLKAQGSLKFDEDGADFGYTRRHSLPASTNGKLSSLSPRIQKPIQANGKGGTKANRSLTTSRDDKVLQPGWRR